MLGHYYPVCPEPERTMGIVAHTDPGVLTVLAQDHIGGLQVKHTDEEGRSQWVDVKPGRTCDQCRRPFAGII
jgi:isopenicillin N synthase-like dioxygenase